MSHQTHMQSHYYEEPVNSPPRPVLVTPAIPAPLPPPPGLLEMQRDSVFTGQFDVPKLGVEVDYKPPEVLYNELYSQTEENTQPMSRHSFSPTPSPFLPTPPKPSYENQPRKRHSSRWKAPQQANAKVPPYVPPVYNHYGENQQEDFFKPMSSPSLTFEPDYLNEVDDSPHYNEEMLHAIVQNELDYEEQDVFTPFPHETQNQPIRPELLATPSPASFSRSHSFTQLNEPKIEERFHTTPDIYTDDYNYDYESQRYPQSPYQPYPPPEHQPPTFLPHPSHLPPSLPPPSHIPPSFPPPQHYPPAYPSHAYEQEDDLQ